MHNLEISLLGPFQVALTGLPATGFGYDKVRALLAYLVVESAQPHQREKLATLLWPDDPPDAARASLRKALSTLRRAIRDKEASPPFLLAGRDSVQINPASKYWLDIDVFDARLEAGAARARGQAEACQTCIADLEEAARLYRGDFLQGLSIGDSAQFEEWMLIRREHFHARMLTALHHLTRHYLHRGEYAQAQKYALQQIKMEPYREEAHRALMHILARSGQRSAALAQYERCRRIMEEELGVAPSAETRALYERICSAGEDHPRNIPPQFNPLVGREGELQAIARRLANPDCRLLTLVGMGGIGKTHLALQAAEEQVGVFLHGVYFVPLAPLSSTEFIVPGIANALDFSFSGRQDPKTQLLGYLREKEILLVLDNFEHLIEATGLLLDILRQAPGVKIMVTSRERLNVRAEWVFDVRELTFPETDAIERVEDYSAVQMFRERARRAGTGFSLSETTIPAVARICQLVEGIPLGVELAAASIPVSSCDQIAAQIARNLDYLKTAMRDVPERQRSMRAVFEYSWNLLSKDERRVFSRLSVFRGGFEARAARIVAGASERVLSALVSKSLVRSTPDDRYEMHELLRQYAAARLDESPRETDATRDRHCEYYAGFLYRRAEHLKGDRQKEALAEINAEIENVRAAWQWAVDHRKELALEKSVVSLLRFYERRSWFREGLTVFGRAAASLGASWGPVNQVTGRKAVVLSLLLSQQGWYSHRLGLPDEARDFLQKSLAILRRQGTRWELANVLNELGVVTYRAGDYIGARQIYEESMAVCRQLDERRELAVTLSNLGNVCRALGEYEQARKYLRESVEVFREHGDQYSMAVSLNNLGEVFRSQGDYPEARRCYREGLAVRREIGDRMGIAVSLTNLGGVAQVLGEYEESRKLSQESLDIFVELQNRRESAYPLHILGLAARDLGEYDEALGYYREAVEISMETQNVAKVLDILKDVSFLLVKKGKKRQAAELAAMVFNHPSVQKETRRNAESILSALEAELPVGVVAAARRRGREQKLEDVVENIMAAG